MNICKKVHFNSLSFNIKKKQLNKKKRKKQLNRKKSKINQSTHEYYFIKSFLCFFDGTKCLIFFEMSDFFHQNLNTVCLSEMFASIYAKGLLRNLTIVPRPNAHYNRIKKNL